MNNENLESQVLKKKNSSRILFIVLALIVLGVVSLYGGIKIFSKLSISADSELPPVPGDPIGDVSVVASVQPSATNSAIASATTSQAPVVSRTPQPPTPPGPTGPPIPRSPDGPGAP